MARYIDADALIEKIKAKATEMFTVDSVYEYYMDALIDVEDIIKAEPTAGVVERKKGEWEEIEVIADAYDISGVKTWASKMKCDQCGFTTIAIEGHFSQYNFCPNCGARMEVKTC